MTDEARVAEAIRSAAKDDPAEFLEHGDYEDHLARAVTAAMRDLAPPDAAGQLTAEEAKAAMLGLEEIWKDFLPHTLESSSLDDAENAYRKLSLIANGEKP